MGLPPQSEGITIDFDCQFKVHLQDSRISTILAAFAVLLPQLLKDFFRKCLLALVNMRWLSRKSLLPASAAMMQISYGRHGMERKQRSMAFIAGWNCTSYRYSASDAGAKCI
jgi:hypothetical protein